MVSVSAALMDIDQQCSPMVYCALIVQAQLHLDFKCCIPAVYCDTLMFSSHSTADQSNFQST